MPMKPRKRFLNVLDKKPVDDRMPMVEWAAWWDKTIERWHAEGLPQALTDRYEICRHFGLDMYKQDWFAVCGPNCPMPESHGSGIIKS